MKWALVNNENVVMNVVDYDGVSSLEPIDGLQLLEVNDWINIGDSIDMPQPVSSSSWTAEELKQMRNDAMSQNLAIVACYRIEQKANPTLTFSDYLDQLENEAVGQ